MNFEKLNKMKRFQFKFESVEKVRRSKEDESLRALGQAQQKLQSAKEHKSALEKTLAQSLLRRENLPRESTEISAFHVENQFISGTKVRIQHAQQAILRAQRAVEKSLAVYLHCRRQTKVIEVLKEKSLFEFKEMRKKHEQKQQDDLYVMRASVRSFTSIKREKL